MEKGNEFRTTVICVDGYENKALSGRFYNPYCEAGESFESLTQMLLKIDDMLNEMRLPQSFTAVRTFAPGGGDLSKNAPVVAAHEGKLATFAVRILFRQNASWQGNLLWAEKQMDARFRSVLELVRLMDSALSVEENVS